MWPKVFAQLIPQLIDILPHVNRVVPMADKFLTSKAASDAAIVALAEDLRRDMTRMAGANSSLSREIAGLSTQIIGVGETAESARAAATALAESVITMDREIRSLRSLLVTNMIAVILLILMVGWLLLTRSR